MASNGVAANPLMLGIVAAGLVSLTGLEREAWPAVPFDSDRAVTRPCNGTIRGAEG